MAAQTYYRCDYRPSNFQITTTNLTFDLSAEQAIVTATLQLQRTLPDDKPLVLDGSQLTLLAIELDNKALTDDDYHTDDQTLTIYRPPQQFTLTTKVALTPQTNTSLEGLYLSNNIFCTQCEPHGFRKITYYLDRPDVLSEFTTTIIADPSHWPVLLAGGNHVQSKTLSDGRSQATWHDPHPKPSYLFALVAGDLACISDSHTTRFSGRSVDIKIYALQQDIKQCNYALGAVKDAMIWDEQRFGLEYDLDVYMIVAIPDFNMGAMENKGLNLFNTKYVLAEPETATDQDFEQVQAVIGHEYFHNWTGNRVTCRDWFQLSLKEGLTVFRDQEFTADHHEPTIKRIEDANIIKSAQFAEDASPMAHPIRPDSYQQMNNFYTATVYCKGAEVIRMLHTLLGKKGFRRGMDLYFERHDGQAVTCDDFVAAMEDAGDLDLTQFRNWYSQAGTPTVKVKDHYDPDQQVYTLTMSQSCPPTPGQQSKEPFYIPIKTGLIGPDGASMKATYGQAEASDEHLLILSCAEQSFKFTGVSARPTPSLLRDFSAPVKLDYDYTNEQLLLMFSHDDNQFNRWDSGQRYAINLIQQMVAHKQDQTAVIDSAYLHALGQCLLETDTDPALIAWLIKLPSLTTVAQSFEQVPVARLTAAYQQLQQQIGYQLQDTLLHHYHNLKQKSYSFDQQAAAKRSLRNTCLHYLLSTGQEFYAELAYKQYQQSDNMTDQIAAFIGLVNYGKDQLRDQVIADFYHNWQQDALVMDKWLASQAGCCQGDTFARVQELTDHQVFDRHNPNKVRSLLGVFANNYYAFHREDGSGYNWLADWVLELDKTNPQVAASLVRPLMHWHRYCEPYQNKMRQALVDLQQHKGLSSDVSEIIDKSLS